MSEHITWVKISASARRWMQSLNRDQENECIALVEFKKMNVLELNRECNNKANRGLQVFFAKQAKKLGMLC